MDEIKKAMLGDKEAQREVTDRWELLPCPHCGNQAFLKVQGADAQSMETLSRRERRTPDGMDRQRGFLDLPCVREDVESLLEQCL